MSDSPRTDAISMSEFGEILTGGPVMDLARTLERENATLRAEVTELLAHAIYGDGTAVVLTQDCEALETALCERCHGTGLITIKTWPGGIEIDNDDQPCPDCIARAALAKAVA